ncbi:DUF6088 family protein [Lentilitoribacter sp. EG35]|uniref:DUF6088 family protein n=1 Tax=Lentilitoribacter sp. EG35 TaxID=3234192 RepID=UPI00345FC3B4
MNVKQTKHLPEAILARIQNAKEKVWTPADFADLGSRAAVDKALQRMVKNDHLRRIERGLYDLPGVNSLTGKQTVPDYRAVIEAVTRRDHVRWLIDGMTAANTLGFTNAVPAKIEVLVDARLKTIELGQQKIIFKQAVPSRLYWAGRPGMYLVQALHWLHDILADKEENFKIRRKIEALLNDAQSGQKLFDDLMQGLSAMPIWMQETLRQPLLEAQQKDLI